MCVIIICYKVHAHFPLILLHGRDEVLTRATASPELSGNVLCGRDGLKHGTWCGVNVASGAIVFLTNYRTVDLKPSPYSRGTLVMDHLEGRDPFRAGKKREEFGPHNVIRGNVFDADEPLVYETSVDGHSRILDKGVYALSNSTLDDLTWPKVQWMKEQATKIIQELQDCTDAETIVHELSGLLVNDSNHPYAAEEHIPKSSAEELLRQRIFLHKLGHDYGTRCHSVCVGAADGNAIYMHREIDLESGKPGEWMKWELQAPSQKDAEHVPDEKRRKKDD